MPRTLNAHAAIQMPEDEFEEAEAKLKAKPLFNAFLVSLREAGFTVDHSDLKTTDTSHKPNGTAPATGKPRGRPPRDAKAASPSQDAARDTV